MKEGLITKTTTLIVGGIACAVLIMDTAMPETNFMPWSIIPVVGFVFMWGKYTKRI